LWYNDVLGEFDMNQEEIDYTTDRELARKYWELKTLSMFSTSTTVNGIKVDFAFGEKSFRYWHGSTIVKFDFSNTDDIKRFLDTTFLMAIGNIEV
jgi:hypothetical protein